MKNIILLLAISFLVAENQNSKENTGEQPQYPVGLLCNLLSHPEFSVITDRYPSFGWQVPFGKQVAYRILVSSSSEKAAQHEGDVWDSGRIKSAQSINVGYNGQALQANQKYWWKVAVWGKDGKQSAWSMAQQFNIGDFSK